MKIKYTCSNQDCEHEFKITVSKYVPARIHGRPEDCYPAEGGEIEPENCPECGCEVDAGYALTIADEARQDARDRAAEMRGNE